MSTAVWVRRSTASATASTSAAAGVVVEARLDRERDVARVGRGSGRSRRRSGRAATRWPPADRLMGCEPLARRRRRCQLRRLRSCDDRLTAVVAQPSPAPAAIRRSRKGPNKDRGAATNEPAGHARARRAITDDGARLGGDQARRRRGPTGRAPARSRRRPARTATEHRSTAAAPIRRMSRTRGRTWTSTSACRAALGGVVGEAGGDQRGGEVVVVGHDAPAGRCASRRGPGPRRTRRRAADRARRRRSTSPSTLGGDRHREARDAVEVVRGAVDRVDEPPHADVPGDVGAFLADDAVVRPAVEDAVDDERARRRGPSR